MDDKLIKEAMAEAGHKGGLKRAQTVSKAKRDKWSAKGGLNRGKHSKEQLRIWALKGIETRRRNKLNKS